MEPPGFMTWPSNVTILNRPRYFWDMTIAASISDTMTVLPSRFSTMPRYFSSLAVSWEAMPTKPRQFSSPFSCRLLPWMLDRGRKVARPPPVRFK